MTPERLGPLIGAVFGVIFVLTSAGTLPSGVGTVLRVLGVVAFLVVLAALRRPRRSVAVARPAGGGFGRGYGLIVAAEVVAIVAGQILLNGPLDAPEAGVAWVALVVGVHFIALAILWEEPVFHWLGASMAVCGALGLALAVIGSSEAAIASVGGLLPGALLLAFSLWGSRIGADVSAAPPVP